MSDFDATIDSVLAENGGEVEVEVPTTPDPFEDNLDEGLDAGTDEPTADAETVDEDEVVETTEPEVFDWTSDKDRLVSVVVNGETVTMTLGEAMSGAMRQADYTRKTQELSQIRQDAQWAATLKQHLEADPQGTLEQLARHLGVGLSAEPQVDPLEELDPEIRPWAEKVQALEASLRRFEQVTDTISQERITNEIRADVDRLGRTYPDFDVVKVGPIAMDQGVSLEVAYKMWRFDQQQNDAAATAAAQEAAAKKAQRAAAAAAQAGKVAKPTGVRGDPRPANSDVGTFEDMFNQVASEFSS